MDGLRIFGAGLGAVGFLAIGLLRFRFKRLRNQDLLAGWALSLALIEISLFPETLNSVLSFFSFEKGGGERLIGLLIFSNFILYILVFASLARNEANENALNRLVRELAKANYRQQQGKAAEYPIFVIIPAYNEAENIGAVLKRIPEKVEGLGVGTLVVVDGATDDTEEVVRKLAHESISHIINRGGGEAIRAGCEVAIDRGAEIIVTLDADGQHMPEEIPELVRPVIHWEADLVNGSRVLGEYEKDSQLRALGVVLFNWLISALTMTRITDCSNAFRAIRASEYLKLDLRQSQYHSSEMLLEAIKKGLRVKEVPITIKRRASGESKKGPSLQYSWGFFKAMLSTWLR